jgi:hypothetical protein
VIKCVVFRMESVQEQIFCVKFCFREGEKATGTYNMLNEVYGNYTLKQTMT